MKTATKAAATGSSHTYPYPYTSCQAQSTSHSLGRSSHSHRAPKPCGSTTPLASPRGPYSVGQNHPPKLSPNRNTEIRASSPNYFGLVVESSNDPRESSGGARNHWSPPSSSIKSFGAAVQTQVPLDANPEFEAFKRQVDFNKGNSFPFTPQNAPNKSDATFVRPRPPRWHTHASDTGSEMSFVRPLNSTHHSSQKVDADQDSLNDSAYFSAESKRNSDSSLFPLQLPGQSLKFESPRPMDSTQQRTSLTKSEDRDPRLSLMEHRPEPPSPKLGSFSRSATLPVTMAPDAPRMVMGDELKDMIKTLGDNLLLLDIRSSQNHAASRIKGSLNLCIPTTLLKRATFNTQKLFQTFQGGKGSERFAQWRKAEAIVVYDSHASDHRDAVTAQNMVKKFVNEGYTGKTGILKGGFTAFKDSHPKMVDQGPITNGNSESQDGPGSNVAPVIGGVSLPITANGANPFFSNIRQNMDLADGVGQFKVARPQDLDSSGLPTWLRQAVSEGDEGKNVSNKFLQIEVDEKSRMQSAYAAFDPHTAQKTNCVQLCGVEKGGKNRYKDILPFEHARVRLQNKPAGSCDYVNASHLRPSGSNKHYIASQGPLPATFEDFWSVIWEQDVRVIVMLTAETEGGQLKCHPYWNGKDLGQIKLKPLSEKKASLDIDKYRQPKPASANTGEQGRKRASTMSAFNSSTPAPKPQSMQEHDEAPFVTIRKFALTHAAHPFEPMREITQLHFSSWPDFGTPAQPSHLLALVEMANVMQRAAAPPTSTIRRPSDQSLLTELDEPESDISVRPMLVHCSAGCGRTGTFCTVDSVIDMLKRQRQDKRSLKRNRDAQGDVAMDDASGELSPRTKAPKTFDDAFNLASSPHDSASGTTSLDATWIRDDAVDLIQKTVDDFRKQRLSMVQTLRQYVLCYETVLEWAHRANDTMTTTSKGRARGNSFTGSGRN